MSQPILCLLAASFLIGQSLFFFFVCVFLCVCVFVGASPLVLGTPRAPPNIAQESLWVQMDPSVPCLACTNPWVLTLLRVGVPACPGKGRLVGFFLFPG